MGESKGRDEGRRKKGLRIDKDGLQLKIFKGDTEEN